MGLRQSYKTLKLSQTYCNVINGTKLVKWVTLGDNKVE